jgi:hypothetical protein
METEDVSFQPPRACAIEMILASWLIPAAGYHGPSAHHHPAVHEKAVPPVRLALVCRFDQPEGKERNSAVPCANHS